MSRVHMTGDPLALLVLNIQRESFPFPEEHGPNGPNLHVYDELFNSVQYSATGVLKNQADCASCNWQTGRTMGERKGTVVGASGIPGRTPTGSSCTETAQQCQDLEAIDRTVPPLVPHILVVAGIH